MLLPQLHIFPNKKILIAYLYTRLILFITSLPLPDRSIQRAEIFAILFTSIFLVTWTVPDPQKVLLNLLSNRQKWVGVVPDVPHSSQAYLKVNFSISGERTSVDHKSLALFVASIQGFTYKLMKKVLLHGEYALLFPTSCCVIKAKASLAIGKSPIPSWQHIAPSLRHLAVSKCIHSKASTRATLLHVFPKMASDPIIQMASFHAWAYCLIPMTWSSQPSFNCPP